MNHGITVCEEVSKSSNFIEAVQLLSEICFHPRILLAEDCENVVKSVFTKLLEWAESRQSVLSTPSKLLQQFLEKGVGKEADLQVETSLKRFVDAVCILCRYGPIRNHSVENILRTKLSVTVKEGGLQEYVAGLFYADIQGPLTDTTELRSFRFDEKDYTVRVRMWSLLLQLNPASYLQKQFGQAVFDLNLRRILSKSNASKFVQTRSLLNHVRFWNPFRTCEIYRLVRNHVDANMYNITHVVGPDR